MGMELDIIGEVVIPTKLFPENSSKETRNELQWLSDYNNGVIDEDFVKDGDNVEKVFENYCKDNGLEYNNEYYKQIIKESGKTILILKNLLFRIH